MPVYLAHGFRWPRDGYTGIRVHAIVHDIENMSVEYIQNEQTSNALHEDFRKQYPEIMKQLEDPRTGRTLHFLEQYDPDDESSEEAVSQKHAFVADRVIVIAAGNTAEKMSSSSSLNPSSGHSGASPAPPGSADGRRALASSKGTSPMPRHNSAALSLNVEEAMSAGPAVTPQAWEALAELRDKIAEGERIGWWIVYNGDPDRSYDSLDDSADISSGSQDDDVEDGARTPTQTELFSNLLGQPLPTMLPAGMKAFAAEHPPLEDQHSIGTAIPHPPPPLSRDPAAEGGDSPAKRPKSSRSFVNPLSLRKRASKGNLQPPKDDNVPEPPKLKKINKREGFRHKFFGGTDKA